jgi:HK97 family phage portal protein
VSLRGALVRPRNDSPVPLVSRNYGGTMLSMFGARRRQDTELLATYSSIGTVFAIVHSLAVATSKQDWTLYRTAASGLPEDRVLVTKHAAIDLWNRPNPFMPRRRFMELAEQHIDLVGESDVLVSSAAGIPLELWPLRPDRITPVPDPYTFIKGYVYTSPDGERIPLDPTECLPIMMPNPSDPYRGIGPVQSILTNLDSVKQAEEYEAAFYANSAQPGGIIMVPNQLGDVQFDQLRDRWASAHQGASKAHRVAILENGMQWVDRAFSQRDMQFAELRTVRRDTILEAFGFPKPMLGITEDVNRANAEAAEYVYSKWLITERLDRWKDWLNFQLLPLFGAAGRGLEWDYESPVSENSENEVQSITAKSAALVAMAGAGFDAAETQEWLDLPEISYTKPEPPKPPAIIPASPGQDPNGNGDGETVGGEGA